MADGEETRLLEEMRASPDDDGLRLVYADHLLQRGDPRGELYAIQTELERGVGPWRRFALAHRESDLVFSAPRLRHATLIYRRGAPDGYRIDPADITDEFDDVSPHHLQLMRWSTTGRDELVDGFNRLSAHPRAREVRELDISSLREWGWETLLGSELRPRRLVLPTAYRYDDRSRGWLDDDVVRDLRDAPLCRELEELELSAALDDAALEVLAEAPWVANLTTLVAGGVGNFATMHGLSYVGYQHGPLGDAGVRTIARRMPALRRLDLRWNRVTPDGVRTLAASALPLDELRLSLDGLGVAGLAALAKSRLAKIARVWPGVHAETEPAAYRALVESPLWAERWIDLWVDKGDDLGPILDELASARDVPPIDELRIRGAKLDRDQLARLLASPAMTALKRLALVEVETADPAVFTCTGTRPLEGLFLVRCNLGPGGLEAVLASPHAANLSLLTLEECALGDTGVQLLARSAVRPIELDVVDRTEIETIVELLASPVLANVERLRLFLRKQSLVFDSTAVMRVLLESSHLASIREISLQGLEALSKDEIRALLGRFGAALKHPRR